MAVLDVLALEEHAAVERNLAGDDLLRARVQLEQSSGMKQHHPSFEDNESESQ